MKPSSGRWNVPSDKPPASPSASSNRPPPGASPVSPSASPAPPGASGRGNASSAKSPRISIIIPTLNEASTIEDCLGQFGCDSGEPSGPGRRNASIETGSQSEPGRTGGAGRTGEPGSSGGADERDEPASPGETGFLEIIVVDGGSDDGTPEVVRSCPGASLIESGTQGRAVQMNAGAAASSGDVLLFLHADTRLPACWQARVTESIHRRGKAGGRFRFDIAHAKWIYRWIAGGTNFRSRFLGITYGDQAIYTTREAFEAVGGFPDIPVFEDARFADRLKQAGGLDWIDEAVRTSARRWERRGPVRTVLLTWLLRLLYTLFVPPRFLARFYGVVR